MGHFRSDQEIEDHAPRHKADPRDEELRHLRRKVNELHEEVKMLRAKLERANDPTWPTK